MNLDALIKTERLPWAPNDGVRDLDVWVEYEHPIAGTFTSENMAVLFTAVGSLGERITVWAYTCLSADEANSLEKVEFDSVGDLQRTVEDLLTDRRIVLAMASDLRIKHWSAPEETGSPDELALRFLEWVLHVKTRPDPQTKLRAAQAQVDVATAELVDA